MPAVLYRRQRQVLEFVATFIQKNGYGPTLSEICRAMKLSSPATVHEHIKSLERKGIVRKNPNDVRGIEIISQQASAYIPMPVVGVEVPLLGYIHAGHPLEPYEDPTATFKVTANLVPANKTAFVLQVKGDSMIEDGILPGDYVVLVKEDTVKNGDVVVALLDNGLATLKKFFRENDKIKLAPANSKMEPIYATDVQVQGKMVALVRKYT
jgi:repressor LexA